MKFEQIKELIKILENSNLQEINYSNKEDKILLKKPSVEITQPTLPKTITETTSPPKPVNNTTQNEEKKNNKLFFVESPLVGTFYTSSSPESEPYIKVGSKIKKGDPLCIIEAMKIMNVIESEVNGTVKDILINNAYFVEYKSKIITIELD